MTRARLIAVTLVVLAAILGGWLLFFGAFDSQLERFAFRRFRTEYQSAAEQVVADEHPDAQDRRFVFYPKPERYSALTDGRIFAFFQVDGNDFVYFDLHDSTTLSSGLVYSASGALPPAPPAFNVQEIAPGWFNVSFENAYLEAGRLEP